MWSLRIRGHGDFEDFPAIPVPYEARTLVLVERQGRAGLGSWEAPSSVRMRGIDERDDPLNVDRGLMDVGWVEAELLGE